MTENDAVRRASRAKEVKRTKRFERFGKKFGEKSDALELALSATKMKIPKVSACR